jgi:hypothetical protein
MHAKKAWALLGLEPTEDRRAIKKAYAAKLKAIDPDKDIAHFQNLRAAMKTAEWEAERLANPQDYEHWDDFGDDWDDEDEASTEIGEAAVEPEITADTFADPMAAITNDDIDAAGPTKTRAPDFEPVVHDDAEPDDDPDDDPEPQTWDEDDDDEPEETGLKSEISALLWGDEPIDEAALKTKVTELINDPAMEQIDASREVEEWLGWTLFNCGNRADSVIPMVVKHFNWAAQTGMVGGNYYFENLAHRADDLGVVERLKDPTHRWHRAYAVLTSPAPPKISFSDSWKYKTEVGDLLQSLRAHNPEVEQALDADHVALWDKKTVNAPQIGEEGNTGPSIWVWLFIGWIVIKLIGLLSGL